MTLNQKQEIIIVMALFFLSALLIVAWVEGGRARVVRAHDAVVTSENSDCVDVGMLNDLDDVQNIYHNAKL